MLVTLRSLTGFNAGRLAGEEVAWLAVAVTRHCVACTTAGEGISDLNMYVQDAISTTIITSDKIHVTHWNLGICLLR